MAVSKMELQVRCVFLNQLSGAHAQVKCYTIDNSSTVVSMVIPMYVMSTYFLLGRMLIRPTFRYRQINFGQLLTKTNAVSSKMNQQSKVEVNI